MTEKNKNRLEDKYDAEANAKDNFKNNITVEVSVVAVSRDLELLAEFDKSENE